MNKFLNKMPKWLTALLLLLTILILGSLYKLQENFEETPFTCQSGNLIGNPEKVGCPESGCTSDICCRRRTCGGLVAPAADIV